MRRLLWGCWPSWLLLLHCNFEVHPALSRSQSHPGFEVLLSASHYWPLEHVDGIHELQETKEAWPAYSLPLLPSYNTAFVPTSASAYSNDSATVDMVEGKVNKGIYLKEDKGLTLLYYERHKASCLSNPAQCSPEGVTFSFFWKTQGKQPQQSTTAYGRQILSEGFKVSFSSDSGSVELYEWDNSMMWGATFSPLGPHWTHILFTWKFKEGLKVYVNGTLRTEDPSGKISQTYGQPRNIVISFKEDQSQCYENGAFDEFVIWERALTPNEVDMYFRAAVGKHSWPSPTPPGLLLTPTANTLMPTNAYQPIIANLTEERKSFQSPGVVLNYLQNVSLSLPHESLSKETALNLTETFLKTVGEVLLLPSWTAVSECIGLALQSERGRGHSARLCYFQDNAVVPSLLETVDAVMSHISSNLLASKPQVAFSGSSSVAEFSVVKLLPETMNASHYRFPAQGHSYIEIPHEAFHSQAWTTMVGLLYHTMHRYLNNIRPDNTKIPEAAAYRSCLLSATSYLISLEVTPPPMLAQNLSASPLITVHLEHRLTDRQHRQAANDSNRVFLYCAFLDFSSGQGVWSNQGCVLIEGSPGYSVCRCTHLTNFAILMQVVPLELTYGHQVALSSISYIGCSLSVLCLAITLVTFAMLSSVSTIRNQRYHIHANLSFAILVAQVLLLISFHCQPGTVPCQVLAVLLHYFFLGAFAWMLVEGLHLYSMVVKVFGSEDSKHRCYYGIGWGLPLLVCVISVSCAVDSYGTRNNCWLSLQNGAIWAFVGPALLIIVVNVGILVAVTRVISQISADNYKAHRDPSAFKLTAKAVAVLLPILGTSWVFGVLAVNHQAVAFQYIFAILNSLQGFFIFLFHCLLNSEVRAAFKHKTKVWSLSSSTSRSAHPKPFSSDVMNGTRPGTASSKLSPWDKSSHSAHGVDLSPV